MKILIAGGAGYIGGAFVDKYLDDPDYDITVADNIIYEDRYLKDVKFINIDVRDTNKLDEIIHDFDAVILLAALVGDPACAVDAQLSYDINVAPVKWVSDNYKGKIIFMSTCSVYGKNDSLIDETADPNPLSIYAETKLEAEEYLINARPDSLIFRLGTLYGLGDTHSRLRLDLVVNVLTLKAALGETLSVFGGEQWRPLLHVRDVANGINYGIKNNLTGIFNLSEKNYTITDIAKTVSNIVPGSEINYSDIPFEDMRDYKVSNEKIIKTGWKPELSLEDGISELYDIFKDKRVKCLDDDIYHNGNYIKKIYGKK